MKKFMMVAAAVMGISCLGWGATAQAGGWGPGYGNHHHGYYGGPGYNHGRGYGYGYGYRPPVYRAPVYGVPIYNSYPMVAPAYPYYGTYPGTSFGISTPNFGLFIR